MTEPAQEPARELLPITTTLCFSHGGDIDLETMAKLVETCRRLVPDARVCGLEMSSVHLTVTLQ